jgi:hypothetical protein
VTGTADDDARARVGDDPLGRLRDLAGDDPRVQAGVEHLQRAAHEAIAASRALLDVAEDLVDDPRALGSVLELLGGLGGLGSRLDGLGGRRAEPSRDPFASDGDDDPPVQRIPVS